MRALWRGVQRASPAAARASFFPASAYAQLKAIPEAGSDFRRRLLGDFALDLEAAHGLLGSQSGRARLLRVLVPEAFVHWVAPGVCANRSGYWEVPNSRVVYATAGRVASFGIASMISWRGVWYVVHLGAVLRAGGRGVVDDPEPGDGTPQPSATC